MYYNSHWHWMPFSEFIELEVEDRWNYELNEIDEWQKKYSFNNDSKCIWICKRMWEANRYNLPPEMWEDWALVNDWDCEVYEINPDIGFIIEESDDGDGWFIFITKQ